MLLFLQAAVGLALLLFSADYVVRGSVRLAQELGLSTLIIGLTVVAFGTSAPEFVTSLAAALRGAPSMAIGNVVGSNMANMLLILGVAAIVRPIVCAPRAIKRDGMAMMAATVLFAVLAFLSGIGFWHGLVLVAVLTVYIAMSYRAEYSLAATDAVHVQEAEDVTGIPKSLWLAITLLIGGLVGIVIGAELLVRGGVGIARIAGISETVIGLTLVAIGTSLPELATVIVASMRNHGDVAVGNILGSNIFNVLGIAGGVAIISPLPVPEQILHFDIWVLLAVGVVTLLLLLGGRRLRRPEGIGLVAVYCAYILLQFGPVRSVFGLY